MDYRKGNKNVEWGLGSIHPSWFNPLLTICISVNFVNFNLALGPDLLTACVSFKILNFFPAYEGYKH